MGYPTVKADRAFRVLFDTHVHDFTDGQVVEGELARYLAVTGAPVTVLDPGDQGDGGVAKPLDEMTAKQLKVHATTLGVDLGGARKKDEIRAAIDAHIAAAAASEPADTGDEDGNQGDGDDDSGDETGDDGAAGDSA